MIFHTFFTVRMNFNRCERTRVQQDKRSNEAEGRFQEIERSQPLRHSVSEKGGGEERRILLTTFPSFQL